MAVIVGALCSHYGNHGMVDSQGQNGALANSRLLQNLRVIIGAFRKLFLGNHKSIPLSRQTFTKLSYHHRLHLVNNVQLKLVSLLLHNGHTLLLPLKVRQNYRRWHAVKKSHMCNKSTPRSLISLFQRE